MGDTRMNQLPIPPPGSRWEITGTPRGPWMWSSELIWADEGNAVAAGFIAYASAPGATAILQTH